MNLETTNTPKGTQDIHALILGRWRTGIQASEGQEALADFRSFPGNGIEIRVAIRDTRYR